MIKDKAKTEKWQILRVLEDGVLRNAYEIWIMHKNSFGLKPSLNALRKNLQRCFEQGLVCREKIEGSYCYRISEKGRERLRIVRAKKQEKLMEIAEWDGILQGLGDLDKERCLERAAEIAIARKLCDIVISISSDTKTLEFVRWAKNYWQLERAKLASEFLSRLMETKP